MKIMLRFSKEGALRWISHLDTMRTLEKALRRAALPVALSQGFNPHQKMSLAVPLAVGVASIGEFLELELTVALEMQEIKDRLNEVLPSGMRVLSAMVLPERAPALMALVQLSRYRLLLPEGDLTLWQTVCSGLLTREQLPVQRVKKSGAVGELDIRRGIVTLQPMEQGSLTVLEATIETSSQLFVRLQELLDLLTASAGLESWQLAATEPLRLDLGVREVNRFCSLEDYFVLAARRYE